MRAESYAGLARANPPCVRWTPGGISSDIEDRRGSSGFGGFGFGGPTIGCGGFVILLILSVVFHRDFFALIGGNTSQPQAPAASRPLQESPQEHHSEQFVSFVLDDAQSTWDKLLPEQAQTPYHHAHLVVFR